MKRWQKRTALYLGALCVLAAGYKLRYTLAYVYMHRRLPAVVSVSEIVEKVGPRVRRELEPSMKSMGIGWPPRSLQLLAFKQERSLEAWVAGEDGTFRFLKRYPVLGLSGKLGPKTESGDFQVPEGFYGLPTLNPQSLYHLSIRVAYPSDDDEAHREVPKVRMGSDIYVHGSNVSVGCLAIGDSAIEEVFVLAAAVPAERRSIVISPLDPRSGAHMPSDARDWVHERYEKIRAHLSTLTTTASR